MTMHAFVRDHGFVVLLAILLAAALAVIIALSRRISKMAREEAKLRMIDYDPLTGLLNMDGFRKRVEELLHRFPDRPYFLSYNNIRNFKFINDSLGREAGDKLLKYWAELSLDNLSDEEAIGRIEADHYAVLRLFSDDSRINSDVEKVLDPVQHYFLSQGYNHRVKVCSGIYVLTPKDFRKIDVDHMLDLARVAERKVDRMGDHAYYNPEQWERGKQVADIITYLPLAIQSEDIQVWYQPQVDFDTGEIIGAEALCRWDHNKLGWLHPPDYISTLEETGLIYDLDSYVWDRVARDLQRWNSQGLHRSISVNVSRDDFREERDIPAQFQRLLQTYGLTPDQLRVEITETAYAESSELLISTTERLRAIGIQVEMDDFGSGYSSLHMLKEVPVDRIKLDLHFLTESGDPKKSRVIISCMIEMMRHLGVKLIAEGVETEDQARFLQSEGSGEMQGYFFYHPMPVKEFDRMDYGK